MRSRKQAVFMPLLATRGAGCLTAFRGGRRHFFSTTQQNRQERCSHRKQAKQTTTGRANFEAVWSRPTGSLNVCSFSTNIEVESCFPWPFALGRSPLAARHVDTKIRLLSERCDEIVQAIRADPTSIAWSSAMLSQQTSMSHHQSALKKKRTLFWIGLCAPPWCCCELHLADKMQYCSSMQDVMHTELAGAS